MKKEIVTKMKETDDPDEFIYLNKRLNRIREIMK